MENKKGFLQISFAWLFAIIIGAIILFFAIYASVKLINTEDSVSSTETGKEISVLLNPLETGFGEESTTPLKIPSESQINNKCELFGDFGEQGISISQRKSGEWQETGVGQVFYNKYIFSEKAVQGRNFYLFSKPFEFPFKISDLIFLTSAEDKYCFIGAPEDIQNELEGLNQGNVFIENLESCPSDSINVCFSSDSDCDVVVNENMKSVEKTGEETVYYETDALMYGAIFSDSDIYECQVERLMKRLKSLALIYNDKESILASEGCIAEVSLLTLANSAEDLRDSSDLIFVKADANNAQKENNKAYCELW